MKGIYGILTFLNFIIITNINRGYHVIMYELFIYVELFICFSFIWKICLNNYV